jgi:hypothetical protein
MPEPRAYFRAATIGRQVILIGGETDIGATVLNTTWILNSTCNPPCSNGYICSFGQFCFSQLYSPPYLPNGNSMQNSGLSRTNILIIAITIGVGVPVILVAIFFGLLYRRRNHIDSLEFSTDSVALKEPNDKDWEINYSELEIIGELGKGKYRLKFKF